MQLHRFRVGGKDVVPDSTCPDAPSTRHQCSHVHEAIIAVAWHFRVVDPYCSEGPWV